MTSQPGKQTIAIQTLPNTQEVQAIRSLKVSHHAAYLMAVGNYTRL